MVTSMHEVEASPLRDTEWAEGEVREARSGEEMTFGVVEDFVQVGEPSRDG